LRGAAESERYLPSLVTALGGADIVRELFQSGELKSLLTDVCIWMSDSVKP
jgi:hypothetical protein